ncbi:D-ribose pyranase [Moritella viscosa]|uniref:D-ribose pyranase n=1 Tax=Moritella viscosa TaxID=80854 RepID=A0A1K9ZAP6_9GAMM|nr:D-ribose pyranase [Moritella viscosa]SGY93816.1 D-ribose pyranase [Moritella viscosa]SGY98247.1 D-ribose pyranase [Moritella viscosa]SHO05164.1 D-ribose pyranase [Moritella viscosa]SHO05173.1 D-ribose pyranase [Moritella viscosa]SHO08338.1 D-ribose pyranase [Moritella viscosa]
MKKNALINADLSYLVATLGHTNEITICDAGLPVPDSTQRIDLALIPGVPTFIATVKAILGEMQIEGIVLAEEFVTVSPELHSALLDVITSEEQLTNKTIVITYISHEAFKQRTHQSKAVVRTGECTPYANVIFQSGVVF